MIGFTTSGFAFIMKFVSFSPLINFSSAFRELQLILLKSSVQPDILITGFMVMNTIAVRSSKIQLRRTHLRSFRIRLRIDGQAVSAVGDNFLKRLYERYP